MKKLTEFLSFKKKSISIQVGIAISFTVVALFAMGAFGITMYHLFTDRMEAMMSENAVQLLDQTAINLESYLKNMRRISDTMYYSVIKDKDLAIRRVVRMVKEGKVESISGKDIDIKADSICVHGDNPKALEFVKNIRETLEKEGVVISNLMR